MAFTTGNRAGYDRGLLNGETAKLGAHPARGEEPAYGGGWVWATAAEARTFIETTDLPFKAAVYALALPTGWDEDVSPEPDPEDGVHRLLNDAIILHRVDPLSHPTAPGMGDSHGGVGAEWLGGLS